jgi:eukaryotic-like serine/threonine-protein kinase
MREPSTRSFEFGPFTLDAGKRLLLRDGEPVPLAPKVLDTLLALIEHRQDVVSKEQLLSRVWADAVIEEGGLARNISLLRKILGEKPDDHHYIVTVPARGYRFVAQVREREVDPELPRESVGRNHAGPLNSSAGESPFTRHQKLTWWTVGIGCLLLAAAASAFVWRSAFASILHSTPRAAPRLIRLTSTSGLNTDPALAPDGSLVAYASDRARTGNMDIWVQPVGGGTAMRVTSGDGDEVEPSFSPDGSRIAYSGGESGGIYIVGALGGEPHLIVLGRRTRTPRFSPDGRWILYWVGQTAWVNVPGLPAAGATGTLAVVAASGGEPRALARDFAGARYGIWSPDGKKILFLGERATDSAASLDWYVTDSDGGEAFHTGALEALGAASVKGTPIPGAWTQEGVVFTTTDEAMSNVWRLPVSPQTGRVIGSATRLTFGTALERSAAVSAAGHIAFTTLTENVDVWRVRLDPTTGTASNAPERVTDDAARDAAMNVSGDGRTLAFVSSRTGRNEVWLKDLQSGTERQLTYVGGSSSRVTPDGLRVAVQRQVEGRSRVELYETSGGQSSALCDDCLVNGGGWSSDGSRLLISRSQGGLVGVVVRELTSGREVEVARHRNWNVFQPRFSPDDRWVVFHTTNTPDRRQVYVVRASFDGPLPVEKWVPVSPDFGIYPNWSPDGTGIYYFSLRDGYMCAWLQPVDPRSKRPVGEPRAVQHFHQPRLRAATRATPTNDVRGGALYVTLTEITGNIWMLDATKE